MTQKVSRKILCLVMIISLLCPTYLFGNVYGAEKKYEDKYNLQMKTVGVMSPAAKTNPFSMKKGDRINLAVEVCDEYGYEYVEEDYDFGDEWPMYEDISIKGDDGLKIHGATNFVEVEALSEGTHYITATYNGPIQGHVLKPLRIEVNVEANSDNSKIVKMKAVDKSDDPSHLTGTNGENLSLKVGETVNLEMLGFAGDETKLKPELKLTVGQTFKELDVKITDGSKISITGNKELKSKISFKDANGCTFDMNVEIIDDGSFAPPLKWDFDKATGTIKGLLDKDNPTELTIPASIDGTAVKHIGKEAFKFGSYGGKINNQITKLVLPEGLETTAYMSFQGNDLKEVTIPSTMTTLGERTFFGNKNLTKVNFSKEKNLKTIGDSAFYQTGLTNITVPEGVTKIESSAFKECPMTTAQLPSTLEFIGDQAFALDMIEEMTIPANVKKLNENSRGKQGNGIFFRNFKEKTGSSSGTLRLPKINDQSGNATVANTRAVVNPTSVTIKFQDEKGNPIKDSIVATGAEYNSIKMVVGNYGIEKPNLVEGDNHYYTDYLLPFDSVDVYTKLDFTNKIIGENYYAKGNTYTFFAPAIKNYVAPESQSVKLDDDNTVTFVYKEAEKLSINLSGEGLTIDGGETKVAEGTEVTVRIHEPSGKALEKLVVDGETILPTSKDKNFKFNGFDYVLKLKITKNTDIKAFYKDSSLTNELVCSFDKNEFTLGDSAKLDITYRENKIDLDNENLEITFADNQKFKKENGKQAIKPLDAGDMSVVIKVKGHDDLTTTLPLKVKPMKVFIRMEDDTNTAFENSEVAIDKLYLTKGVNYYNDLEFDKPVPILAAEKLLSANGIDTSDKTKFDCGSTGSWMSQMGGTDKWINMNDNGSFMYTVNDVLSNYTIEQHPLTEGDKICIYYDPNWMDTSSVAFFETDRYEVTEGETVQFKLLQRSMTMDGSVPEPKPLSGAYLTVNDGVDGLSEDTTDKDGLISFTFDKPGTYKVSATSNTVPSKFSRPYALVVVKEKPAPPVDPDPQPPVDPDPQPPVDPDPQPPVDPDPNPPVDPDPQPPVVDPDQSQGKPGDTSANTQNNGSELNTNGNSQSTNGAVNNAAGSPKTGDTSNPLLISLVLISAFSVAYSFRRKYN